MRLPALRKPAFLKAVPDRAPSRPLVTAWARRAHAAARWVLAPAMSALGGALLLNLDVAAFGYQPSTVQCFILAATLLMMAARMVTSRKEGMVVMAGWYAGATFSLPLVWRMFFNSEAGWLLWALLVLLLAAPALLAPRRRPALGIAVATLIAAVPPLGFVGLGNPMLLAGALFPRTGWVGLALTVMFLVLSAWKTKPAAAAQGLMLAVGAVTAGVALPAAPDDAWAATTYIDGHPAKSLDVAYARQDEVIRLAMDAVEQGAKVIVFPEATNPDWDAGQAFYWKRVKDAAAAKGAQVLVGVYTDEWETPRTNGLVDLASSKIYPATLSAPASLWQPWSRNNPFPLNWAGRELIPTKHGPAAHLICFEELLPWPLAMQELHGKPTWLLSAANQWFDRGWMLNPQKRSVEMQARLWNLPLVRAVNYPSPF